MGKLEYPEALKAFETALSFSSGLPDYIDFDINYYIAVVFYKTGQKAEAIETYNAILDLRGEESDAYYLRGAIKVEQGRLDEAREDFDQALALSKADSNRLIEIYRILSANGHQAEGNAYLLDAMEQEAKNLDNFEKGRISFYLGDYENARMYLEKARDSSYEAVLYLGKTYEVLGDYNYAVSVYKAYLDAGNESPHIYNQMGICRVGMGEYEQALEAFKAGMALGNSDILQTLLFNEIIVYEYLGDFTHAAVLMDGMDGYLKLYPNDEEARRENYFLRTR
jgi:tetratricopeptide (TPR) repeat protein